MEVSASHQSCSAGITPAWSPLHVKEVRSSHRPCRARLRAPEQRKGEAQRLLLPKTQKGAKEAKETQKRRQELWHRVSRGWQALPRGDGDALPGANSSCLQASHVLEQDSHCSEELSFHESQGWKTTHLWQRPALLVNTELVDFSCCFLTGLHVSQQCHFSPQDGKVSS